MVWRDRAPLSLVVQSRDGGVVFEEGKPRNIQPGDVIQFRNARFTEDPEPIEPDCSCPACASFSRAYVHHLVKSGEILGAMLMTQHNLWFYQRLMQGLREAIAGQRLQAFASEFLQRYRR